MKTVAIAAAAVVLGAGWALSDEVQQIPTQPRTVTRVGAYPKGADGSVWRTDQIQTPAYSLTGTAAASDSPGFKVNHQHQN